MRQTEEGLSLSKRRWKKGESSMSWPVIMYVLPSSKCSSFAKQRKIKSVSLTENKMGPMNSTDNCTVQPTVWVSFCVRCAIRAWTPSNASSVDNFFDSTYLALGGRLLWDCECTVQETSICEKDMEHWKGAASLYDIVVCCRCGLNGRIIKLV